jgi:hypothetical protein
MSLASTCRQPLTEIFKRATMSAPTKIPFNVHCHHTVQRYAIYRAENAMGNTRRKKYELQQDFYKQDRVA